MGFLEAIGIVSIIGIVLYLVAAGVTLFLRGLKSSATRWLLLYLAISLAWSVLQLTGDFVSYVPGVTTHAAYLAILLLTVIFYYTTRSVLFVKGTIRSGRLLGVIAFIAWLVALLIFDYNLFSLPEAPIPGLLITIPIIVLGVLLTGWIGFQTAVITMILKALRNPPMPLIKNRAYYWSLALIFITAGDILFFFSLDAWGSVMLWPGVLMAVIVIVRDHMPDTRVVERASLNYLVMTILTAIVLMVGLLAAPPLFNQMQNSYNPTIAGAVIALLLAALLSPLWLFSQKIANQLISAPGFNPNRVLSEYSQSISNILDPEVLATVAVGLISEEIEIQKGFLFLVDFEIEGDTNQYRLRGAKGMGDNQPEPGVLAGNSPIAVHLRQERKPLRQSDIDLLPQFQSIRDEERAWLAKLGADVYMPIYTKDEWIGMIALGPKNNGLPYFDDDLTLLSILADQTAVALQNAKLVESLMRLNNDFRRAYAAMEQANRHLKQVNVQLENLDRTKSDFISVASHELRTPLTVIRGYNELLLEDPAIIGNAFHAKLINGIQTGIMRMNEIVSSTLDMASIDTRALELKVESISIHTIIYGVCHDLTDSIKERNLVLEMENLSDLPQIEGDSGALSKVFYHLIVNAIKYTPNNGNVTISGVTVSQGQLGMTEGGVEIIVADSGIGIDPEFLELIFTKFYQTGELALHSSSKTKYKGAGPGLGLAIAKGIVEAHRGKIWAESPGHDEEKCPGSQFHVVLPLHYHEAM